MKAIVLLIAVLFTLPSFAARLKDIASFKGVRANQLIGYGLVVGLNGSGDREQTEFTVQSLTSMLGKLGIGVNPESVRVRNVAAVVVTATLHPFAKIGSKLDVMVSSVGDARSLQGGTLVLTPLKGANQKIYAIAQGPVLVGGFGAKMQNTTMTQNHVTVGKIPNGALVEREVNFELSDKKFLEIVLNAMPDFSTTKKLTDLVNNTVGSQVAKAKDSVSVVVAIPDDYSQKVVELMAMIENLQIDPDFPAKVVLNERTGTIVMGENVRLSTIAVSHGNLTISISEQQMVSQPNAFGQGQTVQTSQPQINAADGKERELTVVPRGVSIGEVVKALNALGVSPRDMISIFQSIKASGALQAELEII